MNIETCTRPQGNTSPTRITSVWPKLNKQDQLSEYIRQLRVFHFAPCLAVIEDTVYLTHDEWQDFTCNLLTDRPWLAGKGGYSEPRVRSVVLVVRPGVTADESVGILVDPQGYNYARYVGFYIRPTPEGGQVTNPPGLLALPDVMATTLNGVSFHHRVLFHETQSPTV